MLRQGHLSEREFAAYVDAPLGVLPARPTLLPRHTDPFTSHVLDWLDAHGFRDLSRSGRTITTTLDPAQQPAIRSVAMEVVGVLNVN